jgi:hypothetical protein
MSRATEDKLGVLHGSVADALLTSITQSSTAMTLLLKHEELPDDVRKFLEDCSEVHPSLLTVATKFLKDNNISCDASEDSTLSELEAELKKNRKRKVSDVSYETQH